MNYASVIFVFVMVCSLSYYHFRARYWFHGPGRSLQPDPTVFEDNMDDSIVRISKDDTLDIKKRKATSSAIPK